jgi:hypothetical protein
MANGSCSIAGGATSLLYAAYFYNAYIVPVYHDYPEPVAKKLLRAIFYSKTEVNPKKALEYYKQALNLADELQMDPFSDKILGIKFAIADMLETANLHQLAIDVLELVRADCLKWVEALGEWSDRRKDRSRVLGWTVSISVKLGELYANEYIMELSLAEERIVEAVEITLKEQKRRAEKQVEEEEEGGWLSNEEIGATFECPSASFT